MKTAPWEPCQLCLEVPRDRQGHTNLRPQLESIDRRKRYRVWLTFQCLQCATKWSRHRIRAGHFEWVRVL